MTDKEELFGKLVFSEPGFAEFILHFQKTYGDWDLEGIEPQVMRTQNYGKATVWELPSGLVIVDGTRWALYLTTARLEREDYLQAWKDHAEGSWVETQPDKAGIWPAKSRDGVRSLREIRLVRGQLKDISGGHVPSGQVTTWMGYFWSSPLPAHWDSL
jgi:hypothetical protein